MPRKLADDELGKLTRQQLELLRRVNEETLDFETLIQGLKVLTCGGQVAGFRFQGTALVVNTTIEAMHTLGLLFPQNIAKLRHAFLPSEVDVGDTKEWMKGQKIRFATLGEAIHYAGNRTKNTVSADFWVEQPVLNEYNLVSCVNWEGFSTIVIANDLEPSLVMNRTKHSSPMLVVGI